MFFDSIGNLDFDNMYDDDRSSDIDFNDNYFFSSDKNTDYIDKVNIRFLNP